MTDMPKYVVYGDPSGLQNDVLEWDAEGKVYRHYASAGTQRGRAQQIARALNGGNQ